MYFSTILVEVEKTFVVYIVYAMFCILLSQLLSHSIELFKAVISEVESWMT